MILGSFKDPLTHEALRIAYNGEGKLWICENVRFRLCLYAVTCQVELQFCKMLPSLGVCMCVCSSTDDKQQDGAAPNTATHTSLRQSGLQHVKCGEEKVRCGKNSKDAEFSDTS